MLVGLVVIVMIVIPLFLVTAPRRPLLLLVLVGVASPAATLLSGSLRTTLALFFVVSLVFSPLLLHQMLDLSAVLEVVALGAVDLAVLLAGASWLVGSR